MRTGLANNAYHSLLPIIKSREVHRQTKTQLYKTLIRSILWYGSKAWPLSQTAEKKLNAWEKKTKENLWTSVAKQA